jgi:putative membrane protein
MSTPSDDRFEPDVRFLLANERTLLAWIRTSIALQAGGLAVLQFATQLDGRVGIAVALLLIGATCAAVGFVRHRAADRAIRRGALPDTGRGIEFVTVVTLALGVILAIGVLVS